MTLTDNATQLGAVQTVPFKRLHEALLARRYPEDAVIPADAQALAAELLTGAYRECLMAGPQPLPAHGHTVAVASGRVARAFLRGARAVEFYTADPATDPAAVLVPVLEARADALLLETSASSVWVRFSLWPLFTSTPLVDGTTYAPGDVAYRVADGHVYLCLTAGLGSEWATAAKWAPLPVLASLVDAAVLLALSAWVLGTAPEYAATLRQLGLQRTIQSLNLL